MFCTVLPGEGGRDRQHSWTREREHASMDRSVDVIPKLPSSLNSMVYQLSRPI